MMGIGLAELIVLLAILGAGVLGVVVLFVVIRALTKPKDE